VSLTYATSLEQLCADARSIEIRRWNQSIAVSPDAYNKPIDSFGKTRILAIQKISISLIFFFFFFWFGCKMTAADKKMAALDGRRVLLLLKKGGEFICRKIGRQYWRLESIE
jgi:hypothetical protein